MNHAPRSGVPFGSQKQSRAPVSILDVANRLRGGYKEHGGMSRRQKQHVNIFNFLFTAVFE
jgi:hypothetical protein